MKRALAIWLVPVAACAQAGWLPADLPAAKPDGPTLCVRYYLTEEQGAAVLREAAAQFDTREKWEATAAHLRRRIQEGAGLSPWPRRTPLHARVTDRREHDGYSVENLVLETLPGVFACGNLYRPLRVVGPVPAVLTTHGHSGPITTPESWARHGRFTESVQKRGATLARMGAVVLSIDMFGYGDSFTQFGPDAHRTTTAMPLQVWNAMRALDFLAELEGVDASRLAVTGESGGGTQAFLLAALDPRVAASVPVAMVAAHFFGGCACESGRPIHRGPGHFANNAMIAALAAPRSQLVISDGGDWTRNTPQVEFPFLQRIYALHDAAAAVENVHLPTEGHDYGPSKRAALYRFLAGRFGLEAAAVDETRVTLEAAAVMRCFGDDPAALGHGVRTVADVESALAAAQR